MNHAARAAWEQAIRELALGPEGDDASAHVGQARDRRVRVWHPRPFERSGRFAVDVTLDPPLALGARVTFGRLSSGATSARATVCLGADPERVTELVMGTRAGSDLRAAVLDGDLGVELDDAALHLRTDDTPEGKGSATYLILEAVRLAKLAELARREIGLADWEARLLDGLRRAGRALRLDVDEARFSVAGAVGGVGIEAALVVTDACRIAARTTLRAPADGPTGLWLRPRKGLERTFLLAKLLGRSNRTGDAAFDAAFVLDAPPRAFFERLVEEPRADLLWLGARGAVTATSEELRVVTDDPHVAVDEVAARLLRVESALAARAVESPYR